jgi:hypothetical protein
MSDLNRLEETLGEDLRAAMPVLEAPPEAVERIRRRLEAAGMAEPGRVVPFPAPDQTAQPRRTAPGRPVWRRWTAVAATAALLVGLSSYRVLSPSGQPAAELAAPFVFAAQAEAAAPVTSPALPQWQNGFQYRLETDLPNLPGEAPFWTVRFADSVAGLDKVRAKMGYSEYPDQPNALFGIDDGSWTYRVDTGIAGHQLQPGEAPPPEPQGPPAQPAETERIALAWLKQAGLLPKGPLEMHAYADPARPQYGYLSVRPGRESRLGSSVGGGPGLGVTVLSGKVIAAGALWPEAVNQAGTVPLRSVADAWADVQAGVGVQFESDPWVRSDAIYPDHPTLAIQKVRLDRTLVQSLDSRWYMIPVFVFSGTVDDLSGQAHPMAAYVSAVKPQAGQANFELSATLPDAPAEAAPVQAPESGHTIADVAVPGTVETFADPTDATVRAAALRVAEAAGFRPDQLGKPKLTRMELYGYILAEVPVKTEGLPLFESGSNQYLSGLWIDFGLDGRVRSASVSSLPVTVAGPAVPLLTPAGAWERVQQGKGTVQVIGRLTFPAAQFTAHRTEITRVELAYVRDITARDDVPLEPKYLFWGKAEVGVTRKQVEILAVVPARR